MDSLISWKDDLVLRSNLNDYVLRKRSEILDYVKRDHKEYAWSLPTLSRRLSYFGIKYIDYNIKVDSVINCVQEEMNGPGKLLGYRLMHKKIRENHKQAVPRQLVYDVMTANHYDALRWRALVRKGRKRGQVGTFSSLIERWWRELHFRLVNTLKKSFATFLKKAFTIQRRRLTGKHRSIIEEL